MPLFIQMGEEKLIDGVNITKDAFYERLPAYDPAPTTAAPGPDVFLEVYERLAVLYTAMLNKAETLREQARLYWPVDAEAPIVQITPVPDAHLGVGVIGFACISSGVQSP